VRAFSLAFVLIAGCNSLFGTDGLRFDGEAAVGGATGNGTASGTGAATGSSGGGTTASTTSTTAGGGSGQGAGTGVGGDGGAPATDCWGGDVEVWNLEEADLSGLGSDVPRELTLSPDGLQLTWAGSPIGPGNNSIRDTTRASRSLPFTGNQELVPASGDSWRNPWRVLDQIFLHTDNDHEIRYSQFDGTTWDSTPKLQNGPVYGVADPTLTADGLRMIAVWERKSTDNRDELREMLRPAATAGDEFFMGGVLLLPPHGSTDVMRCPVLSPDGRRLFFAGTYPNDSSSVDAGEQAVWYAKRDNVSDSWESVKKISMLDDPDGEACPQGVTADGCELWVRHRATASGDVTWKVATRTP
jgi:hypothetical protein